MAKKSINIFQSFLDEDDEIQEPEKPKDEEDYDTLQDKKTRAEIKKIQIGNEKEIHNLVERKMVQSFIASIGQSVQMNFVNFARINSSDLAAILGITEKEVKINEFLSDRIGKSLDNFKRNIEKLNDDRMFE